MKKFKDVIKKWVLPPGITSVIGHLLTPPTESQPHKLSPEDMALLADTTLLKDRHKGSRCFILGAGSSVKQQDMKKMAGEFVISVSNTFVHPDFPLFRPKYHVLSPVLEAHGKLHSQEEFVIWLKDMEEKTFDAEMFFHIGDRAMIEENGLFRRRIIHWVDYSPWDEQSMPEIDLARIPDIWSVSETAITVALYLGFEQIYLLGFDHDWFNGLFVYFFDKEKEFKLHLDESKRSFADSEFQMRRHAYIFKKYKYLYSIRKNIFNANADPNSYVDVFPKVDYNSLFSELDNK